MKDRRLLYVAGVLLALGAVLGAAQRFGSLRPAAAPDARSPAAIKQVAHEEDAFTPAASSRSWEPGQQYVYAVKYTQQLSTRQAAQAESNEAGRFHLRLDGELAVTVSDATDDEIHVQHVLRLSALELGANGGSALDASARAALRVQLEAPFYVTFGRRGLVREIHFERRVSPIAARMLRSLVASLQVVLSPVSRDRWSTREFDTTGAFDAAYRKVAKPRTFEKTRLTYASVLTADGLGPPAAGTRVTPSGTTRFTLDKDLWTKTLQGHERVEIAAQRGGSIVVGEEDVESRLTARRDAPERIGAFLANRSRLTSERLASTKFKREPPEEGLKRTLAGATLQSLLAELHDLPNDRRAHASRTAKAMDKLTALFLLQPERAGEVPALIRGESDRNVYSSLIGALSAASNPESVAALARIAADDVLPRAVRVDAIAGLGVVKTPDRDGLESLRNLARSNDPEIRSTATLALGTTSRSLDANGDPKGHAVLDEISQAFHAANDPSERALQLDALANTGSAAALPVIEEALVSQSPQVREAAVGALRLIPDSKADELIGRQLLSDPSTSVRRGAVFAASFRPIEPLLPALSQALRSDGEAAVRLDVVKLIGNNRNQIKDSTVLLNVASRDVSPEVRRVANGFIGVADAGR